MPWDLDPRKVLTPDEVVPAQNGDSCSENTGLKDSPYIVQSYNPVFWGEAEMTSNDWLVEDWLAVGKVSRLAGKVKSGKSTLLMGILHAHNIETLYLTEQAPGDFRAQMEMLGAGPGDRNVMIVPRNTVTAPWDQLVNDLCSEARPAIVIDTLTAWALPETENDAATAARIMAGVRAIAAAGHAVMLVRHERKSGGATGDSARGSSQYDGDADILLDLRYMRRRKGKDDTEDDSGDTRRLLYFKGRMPGLPAEPHVLEWDDGTYVDLGGKAGYDQAMIEMEIAEWMKGNYYYGPPGETALAIREGVKRNKILVFPAISSLVHKRLLVRVETEDKRQWRYCLPASAAETKSPATIVQPSREASPSHLSPSAPSPPVMRPPEASQHPADSAAGNPSSAGAAVPVFGQPDKFGGIPELHGLTCIHADGTSLCPKCKSQYDAYNG